MLALGWNHLQRRCRLCLEKSQCYTQVPVGVKKETQTIPMNTPEGLHCKLKAALKCGGGCRSLPQPPAISQSRMQWPADLSETLSFQSRLAAARSDSSCHSVCDAHRSVWLSLQLSMAGPRSPPPRFHELKELIKENIFANRTYICSNLAKY